MRQKNTKHYSRRRKIRKTFRRNKTLRRLQRGGAETRYIISAHGRYTGKTTPIPEGLELWFFVHHGQCLDITCQFQTQTCNGTRDSNAVELIRHPKPSYNYMLSKDPHKRWLSGAIDCSTRKKVFDLETYSVGQEVELQLVLKQIKKHNDINHPGTTARVYCLFCRNP